MKSLAFMIMMLGIRGPTCFAFDLQQAIDEAQPGATIEVPPGLYVGHFSITRPITLQGNRDVILDGGGSGTVLKIQAPDVRIRRIIFQGSGKIIGNADSALLVDGSDRFEMSQNVIRDSLFGVQILASKNVLIEDNEIQSFAGLELGVRGDAVKIWYSPGAKVLKNRISDGRDFLVWYSNDCLLEGNTMERMRYGIHYMYSHRNIARRNTLRFNSVGIYGMYGNDLKLLDNDIVGNRGPSGYGIALKESDRLYVAHNRLIGNRVGLQIDNSPLSPATSAEDQTLFERNQIQTNDVGITFIGSGTGSLFLKNDIVENWKQLATEGLQAGVTVWENNYWSDYRGIDPRKTGFGTIPYASDSVADDLMDRFEGFKIFQFGPAILALDFAERLVPWLKAAPKAVDHSPSMSPHFDRVASSETSVRERLEWLFCSLVLGGVALSLRKGMTL